MLKKISLALMILLYVGAGINHFLHPQFYYAIIPPYIPDHYLANGLAGISEITLGVLLIFPTTRKWAAYGIVAMLLVFFTVHVYMIQEGGCMNELVCISLWKAWARLLFQPVLIAWAWWNRK